jgi:hypothetical protein
LHGLLQRASQRAHHALGAMILCPIVVASLHFLVFSGSTRLTVVVR